MVRRGLSGGQGRFDTFTERARKVLSLAQEEAQRFDQSYIGTEHILLGLVCEGDGTAAHVLVSLGVQLQQVRATVEQIIGRNDQIILSDIGLSPRSRRVVELAVDEARRLDHHYIGTEHLLLGLLREGEGIAASVLESQGLTLERVRTEALSILSQESRRQQVPEAREAPLKLAPAIPGSNVMMVPLSDEALDVVDLLVEAGICATRADATAWLIAAGIAASRTTPLPA